MKTKWLYMLTGEHDTDLEPDGSWMINVDENRTAYTFFEQTRTYPDDDEIQHVQDFFAGKYCEFGNPGAMCSEPKMGTWE